MAKVYITEFIGQAVDRNGMFLPMGWTPPITEQVVSITNASVQSAAFNTNTKFVRVHVDALCSIAFGASPTATVNTARMAANTTEYFAVTAGQKLAVIENT